MADANAKTWTIGKVKLNRQYILIWVALLVLTLIEVAVPEIAIPRTWGVLALISLAIAKTYLVAWFYMHLVDERPILVLVASAPFIFSVFLTVGLFPWPS